MTKFKSPEEIAQIVFGEMSSDDLKAVREDATKPEDMIRYHHSVGRSIRNKFGLWMPENPYTNVAEYQPLVSGSKVPVDDDPMHPDQVSHGILMRVWELVNGPKCDYPACFCAIKCDEGNGYS